jgi:hypothetical protein
VAVQVPADISAVTVTKLPGPYSRPRFQLARPAEINRSFRATVQGSGGFAYALVDDPEYFTGAQLDWSMPDLTGLPGWNPALGIHNTGPVQWDITLTGATGTDAEICQAGTGKQVTLRGTGTS